MTTINQRRHQRIDSLNLTYVSADEGDTTVYQGMGRTLNVSESGICLETHFSVDTSNSLTITIAFEDVLVDLKGRVVYCRDGEEGRFAIGVEFVEVDEEGLKALKEFIRLFNEASS